MRCLYFPSAVINSSQPRGHSIILFLQILSCLFISVIFIFFLQPSSSCLQVTLSSLIFCSNLSSPLMIHPLVLQFGHRVYPSPVFAISSHCSIQFSQKWWLHPLIRFPSSIRFRQIVQIRPVMSSLTSTLLTATGEKVAVDDIFGCVLICNVAFWNVRKRSDL